MSNKINPFRGTYTLTSKQRFLNNVSVLPAVLSFGVFNTKHKRKGNLVNVDRIIWFLLNFNQLLSIFNTLINCSLFE